MCFFLSWVDAYLWIFRVGVVNGKVEVISFFFYVLRKTDRIAIYLYLSGLIF